jgi:alkylhydroperoxidase family enzyme
MDIRHAVGVKIGIPEDTLAALPAWETSPAFDDRERAALALATQIVRDDEDVTDECFEALRAHFTEPEIVELVFIVGYQTFASQFAKAFRVAPQGFATRREEAVA